MRTLAAGLLAATAVLAAAHPAAADPAAAHPAAARAGGPAFWGYWHAQGGKWAFAATGPAQAHPANGSVEGWRFAKAAGDTGVPPRDRPAFDRICGTDAAPAGRKHVAVVIDYGDAADAPKGQRPPAAKQFCATVARNATGSDVLAAAGRPRADKSGLICAIDDFGTCGTPTAPSAAPPARSSAAPAAKKKSGGGSTGLGAGIAVVVLVAAAGALVAARRRSRG